MSAEGYLQRLGGAEIAPPAERDALIRVGRKLLLDLLMLLGAKVRPALGFTLHPDPTRLCSSEFLVLGRGMQCTLSTAVGLAGSSFQDRETVVPLAVMMSHALIHV